MEKKIILIKDTGTGSDNTSDIQSQFTKAISDIGAQESIQAVRAADLGVYNQGVAVKVMPGDVVYVQVKPENIAEIVNAVSKDEVVDSLVLKNRVEQTRIVLRNCGIIDPENIEDYMSTGGYTSIAKCLFDLDPSRVIDEMKKSGIRGRGGAGFPTWMKWSFASKSVSDEKYVICNADEGDPGAYMDRSVLEGDPHSVIEGMTIAGYAIGSSHGYFYIRAEYPLAIERVQNALKQAYERGLLGKNILGSNFSFDLEIRLGAGAFVCGEETALIASIEGKRGTPSPRPPYPAVSGLWKKPSIINNVETLANVAAIFQKGGDWFSSIGTEKSKGTKVFAVTGKVKNSGLVEIAMGTSIKDIVYNIAGGVLNDKQIMAVQTGGPSGGVIPEKHLDTPVSYEHLQELGSIMGSGGMIVMDQDDCMVDISKFYLKFCVDESCGKCAPCRIGGYQMLSILNKISDGKGEPGDTDKLRKIAKAMQKASLCALGQTAPNPVMSTLRYFEDEYNQHINEKKCRAGKCSGLLKFTIDTDKCKRCSLCKRNCPASAITGDRDHAYVIDQDMCIACGRCFDVCKFEAIARA